MRAAIIDKRPHEILHFDGKPVTPGDLAYLGGYGKKLVIITGWNIETGFHVTEPHTHNHSVVPASALGIIIRTVK